MTLLRHYSRLNSTQNQTRHFSTTHPEPPKPQNPRFPDYERIPQYPHPPSTRVSSLLREKKRLRDSHVPDFATRHVWKSLRVRLAYAVFCFGCPLLPNLRSQSYITNNTSAVQIEASASQTLRHSCRRRGSWSPRKPRSDDSLNGPLLRYASCDSV